MIQVSELRIGNFLKRKDVSLGYGGKNIIYDKPIKVLEVRENSVTSYISSDKKILQPIDLGNLLPIPLTPEILEEFGFIRSLSEDDEERTIYGIQVANNTSLYFDPHKDWMRDEKDYEVEWYLSHEWNNNHFKNDFWANPKYLHQLQNLFHALTGEELQVTNITFVQGTEPSDKIIEA
jgi:hypothetical protein